MEEKSPSKRIFGYFVRGLLLVVPITLIVYVVYQLFVFLDKLIPMEIPGLGIVVLLAGITALGWLGSIFITAPIRNAANRILDRIPLVKTIYTAITDLLSAFVGQKKSFSKPVLVKLNKESDIEKLGFITNEDLEQLSITSGKIAVYLPHSYNFSGNLFIVPRENVTPLNAHTPDVMKFIVSGGVTDIGLKKHEER